jgi:ppGpp synthetase/RelA/SpoT-type nucleotidyltranferase
LIDEFIARYTKEYDFYNQAGHLAMQELEATLQAAGIRSMVTYRPKSISRLREKCLQRELHNGAYKSVSEIFDDVVDLVGLRVALYFPAELEQVDGIINRMFYVHTKKSFPDPDTTRAGKRFTGYSAVHYRVQLKEQDLSDADKRYGIARIEIQVASVLMHAWAEVEHDLVYKPLAGELSEDEHAILDQLNGLVIAGEIALERLQKAGERRVADRGRKFANHYDLAAHLLSRAPTEVDQISEAGLGRVDLLFELITCLGIDTPERLAPYLRALHGDLEQRPLAEQIIDALLAEDESRYGAYNSIRVRRRPAPQAYEDADVIRHVGLFMSQWARLERVVREIAAARGFDKPTLPTTLQLRKLELLPPEMMVEFDQLRRIRNHLVHGLDSPDTAYLGDALERLEAIDGEIERRARKFRGEGRENGPPPD